MKGYLLFPDRDFLWEQTPAPLQAALEEDLQLSVILDAMAQGDPQTRSVCEQVLLGSVEQPAQIQYRQEILREFLRDPALLNQLQTLTGTRLELGAQVRHAGILMDYPTSLMSFALQKLQLDLDTLEQLLPLLAGPHAPGLTAFSHRLQAELTPDFFVQARKALRACRMKSGLSGTLTLGPNLKPASPMPQLSRDAGRLGLRKWHWDRGPRYAFTIADEDTAGGQALSELQQKLLNPLANVLMQTAEQQERFWQELDRELRFYAGCCHLADSLSLLDCPTCFPRFLSEPGDTLDYTGLYDAALTLQKQAPLVPNCHTIRDKPCILVTGANQGGKTTWLRALGQALVLGQAGAPVGAAALTVSFCPRVLTHFRKEEDRSSRRGKLEEELTRMEQVVRSAVPGTLLLMNESFASTNEQDGSELAWQVMTALLDRGVRIACVTHFLELARRLTGESRRTCFLQACRREDGTRTYALEERPPEVQGHGLDLYRRIFGPPH